MGKVELLAPAGNYESFLGAVSAGADAVYFGGEKFGARAYADNFTQEEVCRAIKYAHLYKRKVYLTLNTLVKEREFDEIYEYLLPFYEAGLDGVIIQDLGVFPVVGEWFPRLARHASTQTSVTGSLGAAYLKELGAKRIVPARELSLEEIKEIKKETDIEIETFVHGAICYCYSGQCLFSSMLGGRSGNRGRCAQPCRLPYGSLKEKGKKYPLSLKDMCAIELMGQLIESGIDSFKIEGRMKSPEYAAGVTGIYRKYIDRYYENPSGFYVEKQDMEKLQALYIRSEISQGYYYKHNGRDMITLESPSYTRQNEDLARKVRETYLDKDMRLPVFVEAKLMKGKKAVLSLEGNGLYAAAKGEEVQAAKKQPLTEENVRRQLGKFGNTAFYPKKIEIQMPGDAFLTVKALNDLRRRALDGLEEEIIRANGFDVPGERTAKRKEEKAEPVWTCEKQKKKDETGLHVLALTKEQCGAAIACMVERLYVEAGLCQDMRWMETLQEKKKGTEIYLALPYVLRQKDRPLLEKMGDLLEKNIFSGVLVRNLEELQYWKRRFGKSHTEVPAVSDAGLYAWNKRALQTLGKDCMESYMPYELNLHEWKEVLRKSGQRDIALSVYGRIPMMISANCVAATMERCSQGIKEGKRKEEFYPMKDRYGKIFPVYLNCIQCYNVIYNSLPLSYHRDIDKIKEAGISAFRLDFTVESGSGTEEIIRFWQRLHQGRNGNPPYEEYTKGHLYKGAE